MPDGAKKSRIAIVVLARGTERDAALASDSGRAGEESSKSPTGELKGKVLKYKNPAR
jgi:hypothetical protein